jgi:predicted phage baseplate assembly protein
MALPLCVLPPEPPPGCCAVPEPPPAAPLIITNPAGLPAIAYRIGTYTSFRRAMLDDVNRAGPMPGAANPFAAWREGAASDYQTTFIELWAYLADILTFYQERIANEAYLGTATQRDSLLRLVSLIDYHPSPGSGASGLVAFTIAKDKVISIPAGFRVGSRAKPPVPAAVFETSAAFSGRNEHSAIPLSAVAPTNQFAQLSNFSFFFAPVLGNELSFGSAAEELYGSFGSAFLSTFFALPALGFLTSGIGFIAPLFPYLPFVNSTTRTIVLKGVSNRLAAGDFVVVVENEGQSNEILTPRQISTVTVDRASQQTTITWQEPSGTTYQQSAAHPVALYGLRVTASPFGSSAPGWATLPPTLTQTSENPDAPFTHNWDSPSESLFYLPRGDTIFLDGIYDEAKATPDNSGLIVLNAGSSGPTAFRITGARTVSHVDYATTAKVTQLTVKSSGSAAPITGMFWPFRDAAIFAGSEKMSLQNNLPLPDPVQGDTIILSGVFPSLQNGQTVILIGNLWDAGAQAAKTTQQAEARVLAAPPVPDTENNITTVALNKPLTNQYARAGMVLMANVAEVTQGETVKDEILGSGDGSALQSYPLKKKPLTYVPSTDPELLSAVQSTLLVTVNGVNWQERPSLVDSAPDDQVFTTTLDDAGQTTVVFGDGKSGSRPTTGRDNIHARYRFGLGVSGNAGANGVQQLIDSVPGLQKVTNPQSMNGGADAESISGIRTNAPAIVRTFNRAVSAEDYAALALTFPGIVKASASWVLRNPDLKPVAQPYVQLTVATADRMPLSQDVGLPGKLRSYLDNRRDPNVPLRILDFTPVYIDVAITVDINDRFPRTGTISLVEAALKPALNPDGTAGFFAFDSLQFGENIHLSAIYAAVQAVAGVADATVTTLRRMDQDAGAPATVRDDIFIRPTEIAVIQNDPTQPEKGQLKIQPGKGGFLDT